MTLISSGLVGFRGLHAVAVLGLVLLVSACREDDAETGADSTAGGMAQELFQQLDAGEARIEIAGIVETTGTRDTLAGDPRYISDSADTFRPSTSNNRRGSNADGPYELVLYGDAVHSGHAPETSVRASLTLILPMGAEAGVYTVDGRRADDDAIVARLAGDGNAWNYNDGFSGQLHITEINDVLSASFEILLSQDEDHINILGAVNALPLSPQAEVRYELATADETRQEFAAPSGRSVGSEGDYQLMLGRELYLRLPAGFEAGRYRLAQRAAAPDEAGMRLINYDYDSLQGEITLERTGNLLSGSFHFSTEGETSAEVRGEFDGVRLQE